MRLRATTTRRAFTLIELIVVLGIIALLATLTAAAVMRYQQAQKESNTNTHLRKIHMELEKQWTAKVALIKSEPVPQVLKEYTKNADGTYDNARAKALHMKLRLRQEFPQNFGEVNSTVTLSTMDPTNTIVLAQYVYGSKPAFKTAIKNPVMIDTPLEAQSAAMLALILSQGSGGSTTDVDAIARTKTLDYPQQGGGSIALKVFADEWDNHIAFCGWRTTT